MIINLYDEENRYKDSWHNEGVEVDGSPESIQSACDDFADYRLNQGFKKVCVVAYEAGQGRSEQFAVARREAGD